MTIDELIAKTKGAKMPDERFQNKNVITGEYSLRDMMNGTLRMRYYAGPVKKWMWMIVSIKHCVECSEPIFVFGADEKHHSDSFCNSKCKLPYFHRRLEPIEYNGKIYTLKDCNAYELSRYLNPILSRITNIKGREKRMKDPEYVAKQRITANKRAKKYRDLNPLSEEQRIIVNKNNNKRYHENSEKILAQAKEAKANWTPERKAHASKVKNEWGRQDRIDNPMRYRIKSVIQSVFSRFGKKKVNRTVSYGIDVKAIANYLSNLAEDEGKTFKWMHENNYDIDHIIPVSHYDPDNKDDFRNCNSHFNLRWLSSFENRSRGDSLRPEDIEVIKTLPKEIYPKSWKGVIPTTNEKENAHDSM
tara:strand:+ start:321 stop:1400 length:1080 start_codon:yes stop_codon:yes gene_type:complete